MGGKDVEQIVKHVIYEHVEGKEKDEKWTMQGNYPHQDNKEGRMTWQKPR